VIQLHNGFLWRRYCQYYGKDVLPPHPKSLCNYFWKAMGGTVKWLFMDVTAFLIFPVSLALTIYLLMNVKSISDDSWGRIGMALAALGLTLWTGLLGTFRFFSFICNKFGDGYAILVGVLLGFVALIGLVSVGIAGKAADWTWWHLLWSALLIFGVIVVFMGGVFIKETYYDGRPSILRDLFMAVKNKVCPLVTPPPEWQKEVEEAELNCGDG
jgi:hypothetical protein